MQCLQWTTFEDVLQHFDCVDDYDDDVWADHIFSNEVEEIEVESKTPGWDSAQEKLGILQLGPMKNREKDKYFYMSYKSIRSLVDWFRFRSSKIYGDNFLYFLVFIFMEAIFSYRISLHLYYDSFKLNWPSSPGSWPTPQSYLKEYPTEDWEGTFHILQSPFYGFFIFHLYQSCLISRQNSSEIISTPHFSC